ncbi:hypothetical protein RSO41_12655 [Halomonas sp. I1]|nr:hypothetical protein [Halomonas sp. I1]MDT8895507.1 hypothetical protein [Halomonas sp. I1]
MLAQILSTLLPVFLIAGCGTLYGRYRRPGIRGLNTLNMELFVPMLVFAALPPAVLNSLVAEQYRQQPHQVASLVLIGNLGSLVVMPLLLWMVFEHVRPMAS